MGQKAHPIGNRLGIIKGWDSNWFGGNNYSDKLVEDEKIRKYLAARISKGGISKVVIERTLKRITITIHTARPGIVIGKGGQEVDKIKEELKKLTKKDVQINIFEIKRPELDAQLVGEGVAKQLEARISFRRAMKTSIASTMRMGAEGIKIMCSGRLVVLKWHVLNNIKMDAFLCILSVLISIMLYLKHLPLMVKSVLRFGS
jgi:small subunit ribosomal protein S3